MLSIAQPSGLVRGCVSARWGQDDTLRRVVAILFVFLERHEHPSSSGPLDGLKSAEARLWVPFSRAVFDSSDLIAKALPRRVLV